MKVMIGLSGGVDSAVAAYLLKKKGYEVVAGFMRNWDSLANNDYLGNPNVNASQCPQEKDYEDAKSVADKLGIPLLRQDFVKEYWDNVFSYFLKEYKNGRTPNPDVFCNKYIKFSACGDIWNHLHTDIYRGGQCLDEIAKYIHSPVFRQIYTFWKKYHLNGMHAGTPEQEKAVKEWEAAGNKYDYSAACEMLKACGLYEVPLNCRLVGTRNADGEPYKYGSGWVIEDIPKDDLQKIIDLCK